MNTMYIVTFPSGVQRWFNSLEEAYPFAHAGYGTIVAAHPAGTTERVAV